MKLDEIVAEARDKIYAWQAVNFGKPEAQENEAIDAIIKFAIGKALGTLKKELDHPAG